MKTCATCKHWNRSRPYQSGYGLGIGTCDAVVQFWAATEWNEDGDARVFMPEHKDKKAFVQDGSDYYAELLTMPDFGCIQHEEKQ